MSYSRLLQFRLRQIPLFMNLPESDLKNLERTAVVKRMESGSILASEGELSDHLLVILSGSVHVRRITTEGSETILRRFAAPTVFGYCVLAGRPHSADLVAADTAVVAFVSRERTRELLLNRPEVLLDAISHLSILVDDLTQEKIGMRESSLADRIFHSLAALADVDGTCRVTHEELGRMAGGSRANVSRALKQLESTGRLELGRGRIVLKGG